MKTVVVGNSQKVIQGPIKSLFSPRKTIATHTMRFTLSANIWFQWEHVNVGANGWYAPLLVYLVIKVKGKWCLQSFDPVEIWWHVKHLLALLVDILENLLFMRFERRKEFFSSYWIGNCRRFGIGEAKWRGESVTWVVKSFFYKKRPEDEV